MQLPVNEDEDPVLFFMAEGNSSVNARHSQGYESEERHEESISLPYDISDILRVFRTDFIGVGRRHRSKMCFFVDDGSGRVSLNGLIKALL